MIAAVSLEFSARDEAIASQLIDALTPILARPPLAGADAGLTAAREAVERRLVGLGFEVSRHGIDGHPPVVIAVRPGATSDWLGIFGHYDVEPAGPGWTTEPFIPTLAAGRIFARGIADNLGPLLLRLVALERARPRLPSMVWVLQGEEEVGSPTAHHLFPTITLPRIALWLEETGYYELDGRQRLLLRRPASHTAQWVDAAIASAAAHGRAVDLHDRYLSKSFGATRCPFLSHLVGDATYLAIGPNDPLANIHRSNESLALANLASSVDQFLALVEARTT